MIDSAPRTCIRPSGECSHLQRATLTPFPSPHRRHTALLISLKFGGGHPIRRQFTMVFLDMAHLRTWAA